MVLGLDDGSAQLYKYDPATKIFENSGREYRGDVVSDIVGSCFAPDNSHVILGVRDNQIVGWDLDGD